tara:strand:+ start:1174 stop:3168 length:1995 start_codon:yes stop_codon:yes gene_type:complete
MEKKKLVDPFDNEAPAEPVQSVTQNTASDLVDPFDTAPAPTVPQYESQDSQWSLANVGRQALGQGLALGAGDEVVGTLRGLWNATGSDQSYGDAISEGIDAERAANTAFEEENPYASTALQIGGGLLTGGIGAGRAAAAKGLSLGAKALQSGKVGAQAGGTAGVMSAEGNVLDAEGFNKRALGGTMGAALGGVGGGAMPFAVKGLKDAGQSIARWRGGSADRQAKNAIRNALAEDDMTQGLMDAKLTSMGPLAVPADAGGKSIQDLTRLYSNSPGGKRAHKILQDRHVTQNLRLEKTIDDNIASIALPDYLISGRAARQASARKNYGDVYKAEIELDDKLKGFFQNDGIKDAYKSAKKIAAVSGDTLTPLSVKTDAGTAYAKPNMETLDFIKQGLDDKIGKAIKKNEGKYAGVLMEKRKEFIEHLDIISPKDADGNSLYAKARSEYAGASQALEAAELGKKFASSKDSVSIGQVRAMGEHEREAFLVGVAEHLRNTALSTPDAADVVKRLFGNELARRRLREALNGDEAKLARFEQSLENERLMAITNDSVTVGSRTAPMQQDAGASGIPIDAGDAYGMSSGNPMSYINAGVKMRDALSTPPEAVAERVTDMLLNTGSGNRRLMEELLKKGPTLASRQGSRARRMGAAGLGQFMGSTPGQYFNE